MLRLSQKNHILILGHDRADADSVLSGLLLRDYLRAGGYDCRFAVAGGWADAQTKEILRRIGLVPEELEGTVPPDAVLFLVDHSVTVYPNPVIGCIDHHPSELPVQAEFVQRERASSCAMMILRRMLSDGMEPTETQYRYAVFSVYLDTKSMRSAKFCPDDKPFLQEISARFGFDTAQMEADGLFLTDLSQPIPVICSSGLKYYRYGDTLVAASHADAREFPEEWKEAVSAHLRDRRVREGVTLWLMALNDPFRETTELWEIGERITVRKFPRMLSRSIDIVPELERRFLKRP